MLWLLTETVELGVLVPYPEEGREAKDQRRPSVLHKKQTNKKRNIIKFLKSPTLSIRVCLFVHISIFRQFIHCLTIQAHCLSSMSSHTSLLYGTCYVTFISELATKTTESMTLNKSTSYGLFR